MRARRPDRSGYVDRNGVRIYFESYGDGVPAVVFVPADVFVTGEMWKAQVPYLARRHQVVVIDPRGNGRSDRPTDEAAYSDAEVDADLIAVMDELGIERAVLGGLCSSSYTALVAAAWHPDRVSGVVAIGSWAAEGSPRPERGTDYFDDVERRWAEPYTGEDGWALLNRELWLRDWPRWPRFWFAETVNDTHSTKLYEDLVGWACESDGAAQVAASDSPHSALTPEDTAALLARVECPVLAIHGTHDICQSLGRGAHIARLVGGELLALGAAGHVPTGRDPIAVNHAIAEFVDRVADGTARCERDGPARVRAHLDTRRDAPPGLSAGRRVPGGTAYGDEPPTVVVLPVTDSRTRRAWEAQLPGLARQLPLLVIDAEDALEDAVAAALASTSAAIVLAPPGSEGLARWCAGRGEQVAAVVLVEAPVALAEHPGLLEFFVDRLPLDRVPASIARALVDVPSAEAAGRAPLLVVLDDRGRPAPVDSDAVVTVEGGGPSGEVRPRRRHRDRRVLYLSSPIGLGHVRRDLAIVNALREKRVDAQVDWLSQSPVTEFLEAAGERVHPASAWLANESGHIESEAGEHDLHAFQAIRRMDEILVNNFHVFDDLAREEGYDAWVGDEAWDLDHFLHENPRLKRAPFVWMTDFVGWVPMPDGGEHEAALTRDYNAEMVEHVARYPGLRDRSVFIGDPDDVVARSLGLGLPDTRAWTEEHFAFSGFVTGGRPAAAERERLRERLGYRPDETVCVVSVGGSAVGGSLVARVVDAYDACRTRLPSLRMEVVVGPRLDPASVSAPDGVTVRGFLPDLDRRHAACDVAIVQGGLSTTMELTAAGRPFLYFPLRHHFEQQVHVRHRLDRHRAGRAMDYATATPDTIADALVVEMGRPTDYLPVPDDGAARAAALVAELL